MKIIRIIAVAMLMATSQIAMADQDEAMDALAEILFDAEMENVSYAVSDRGDVDIVFGVSVTDDRFVEVTGKLKSSPAISSVLSSRGMSDFCRQPAN